MGKQIGNGQTLAAISSRSFLVNTTWPAEIVGGLMTTDINGSWDYAHAVALQSDGKIVVAGTANNGIDGDFAVV